MSSDQLPSFNSCPLACFVDNYYQQFILAEPDFFSFQFDHHEIHSMILASKQIYTTPVIILPSLTELQIPLLDDKSNGKMVKKKIEEIRKLGIANKGIIIKMIIEEIKDKKLKHETEMQWIKGKISDKNRREIKRAIKNKKIKEREKRRKKEKDDLLERINEMIEKGEIPIRIEKKKEGEEGKEQNKEGSE